MAFRKATVKWTVGFALKTDGSAEVTNFIPAPVPLEFLQKAVAAGIEVVPDPMCMAARRASWPSAMRRAAAWLPFNAQATDAWAKSVGANPNDLGDEGRVTWAIVSGDDAFTGGPGDAWFPMAMTQGTLRAGRSGDYSRYPPTYSEVRGALREIEGWGIEGRGPGFTRRGRVGL